MKSRYLSNIILVLIIIGLYWFTHQSQTDHTEQSSTIIPNLTPEQVTNIVIERKALDTIHLQKTSQWQIIQPVQAKANAARVNLILNILSQPIQQSFKAPTDLKKFGLDPAIVTLHLNHTQLQFGVQEPLSHTRYIKYQDTLYLVTDSIMPMLKASAASFIDNRLIDKQLHITKIQLPPLQNQFPEQVFQLQNGHWKSNNQSISQDEIMVLIDNWKHAYATRVEPITAEMLTTLVSNKKIKIQFQEASAPLELILQSDKHSLILINPVSKLRYTFPIQMKQQLFVNNKDKN